MRQRIFSTRELAQVWNVSESTIKRWADSGELCCYRTPGGHRKFHLENICDFQNKRGFEATGLLTTEKWEDPEIEESLNGKKYGKVCEAIDYLARHNQSNRIKDLMERLYMRGMGLADLYDRILVPVVESGKSARLAGELTVGQEKLISNNLEEAMSVLFPHLIRRRYNGRTGLCGAPDDRCGLVVNAMCRILEVEGWESLNLGGSVSFRVMAEMVEEEPVNLVCVSCASSDVSEDEGFQTLADVSESYRIPLVLVGVAFADPERRMRFPHDDYFADYQSFQRYVLHLT